MDHLYITNLVILHVKYVILSGGFKHANIQYCTPRKKKNSILKVNSSVWVLLAIEVVFKTLVQLLKQV